MCLFTLFFSYNTIESDESELENYEFNQDVGSIETDQGDDKIQEDFQGEFGK